MVETLEKFQQLILFFGKEEKPQKKKKKNKAFLFARRHTSSVFNLRICASAAARTRPATSPPRRAGPEPGRGRAAPPLLDRLNRRKLQGAALVFVSIRYPENELLVPNRFERPCEAVTILVRAWCSLPSYILA